MSTTTKQRITLFMNPALIKYARARAVVEELTLTGFVEKALIKYLPKKTTISKTSIRVEADS